MDTRLTALLALLLVGLARADAPDPAPFDAAVEKARSAWRVPGVAVAVVRPDEVVLLKGYGVRRAGRAEAVGTDTVFPVGSCTKAITAAGLARLADAGKLDWDDPVRKHLPDFRLSDPHASGLVSVRDLLAHRTGLAGHDLLWYRAPWSQDEQVRRAGQLPLSKPFRSAFQYQTVMWVAAGREMERAGGASWERQTRDGLLRPLGMADTHFTTAAARKGGDFAWPHALGEDGRPTDTPNYDQPEPNPAGSLHSTALDLARWARLHLNDGRHGDKQVVSEAALRETRTPQVVVRLEGTAQREHPETRLMSYGMGWLVQDYRGHLQASHAGQIDGFRCHVTLLPDDGWGFVVLSNLDRTRMNLALSNTLVDVALGLEERNWHAHYRRLAREEAERRQAAAEARKEARRPDDKPSLPAPAYAGKYRHPAYGEAVVREKDGVLAWEWGSFRVPLAHHAGDTFAGEEPLLDGPLVSFRVEGGAAAGCDAMGVTFAAAGAAE